MTSFRLVVSAFLLAALVLVTTRAAEPPRRAGSKFELPTQDGILPGSSRLVNASVRARAGTGDQTLIAGFVITGTGAKPMLIRAVGPALATQGVSDVLTTPGLTLHDLRRSVTLATNSGWERNGNRVDIASGATRLGAFPLAIASEDSALLLPLGTGVYSANVSGPANRSGIAMIEVYDGDPAASAQLVNLSARTQTGPGDDVLILGFVVSAGRPKQILLRGIGPTLAGMGVSGVLADPQLELRGEHGELLATNDNWAGAPELEAAGRQVGAFPLPAGSRDSALLATVGPGVYTVQVKSGDHGTGVALAELYDVPPPDPATRWTMINVSPNFEQADCHLLELPDGRNVLIDIADAADSGGTALAYLRSHHIAQVDLVVLSHFHADHYGRLRDLVLSGIRVGAVAFNLPAPNATGTDAEAPWGFWRADANAVIQFLREHLVFCYTPRIGDQLIGLRLPDGTDVSLDVVCLYDGANTPVGLTDTNDTSMVLRLTHGRTRVLFTGDLNAPLGTWLAASGYDLAADLLKVPHHGTEGAAPNSFFDRVGAKAAFVPGPASLWAAARSDRIRGYFAARHVPTYVSGRDGHVMVELRRAGYEVRSERPPP